MRISPRFSAVATAILSIFGAGGGGARARADGEALGLPANTKLLAPIAYQQLTVFPVMQVTTAADRTQYLTLTEGLEQKLVTVSEVGAGGSVNTLLVHNQADRPLLVLGGEVVLGGQQDRILGQDTIIPAHEHMQVQVFCVEHGRWSGGRQFGSAQGMADTKIRVRAKYRADQSQVWEEVAKKNAAHAAKTATGTYRNLAAGAEGDKVLKPYRDHVGGALAKLPESKQLVGMIAAVNGRVTSVELFARPELFAAYRDKLLDSIYMGASDVPHAPAAAPATAASIGEFLHKAKAAPAKEVGKTRAGTTVEQRGEGYAGSKVSAPAMAEPLYQSYQRDE